MKRTPLLTRTRGKSYSISVRDVVITADLCMESSPGVPQGDSGGILMELDRGEVALRSIGAGGVMEYAPRMHNWDDKYIANLTIEHLDDLLGGSAENERITIRRWVRTILKRLEEVGKA